ncbi:gamma-aminobutyric acid receptor subunit beta-like isoform X1 [Tigriopus californicus]|uniref:gamma-aminobutyric acid receptor subunit beta-like isoform X1 n=1 Tax=Tigriopus californicus TaxID=6832 RepID=UPI0027DAA1F2|nr:gamma-aminobutyric acid receptor subunit beta-like isoform X1 [Tigriopus californicus]
MIGPSFERVAKMSLGMGRIHDIFFVKMLFLVTVLALFFGNTLKLNAVAEGTHSAFADVNISALLNSFQEGYDKRVRPNYGGIAVTVGVSLYVLSISRLSEVEMDFTLDMYFRQFWRDPRLSFDRGIGLEKLVVGAEYIKMIWVPDTFFVNEKKAYFHDATTDNQFLRILHTGAILRSIRLTITASCPMDLQYFPMDRQLCYIEIESFGYTMSDIRYKWNDGLNSVQISADVSLPQFKVLGHRQKTIEASLSTGNYSRLACEIQFVRSMGYYLIQIYIPSSLIVIISWVSFWLNRGATPARVSLGVTTVLTMTTLMASTNAALPKISYVKSIDVYLGACFFMVFASLLEYASVGYMAKRIQMRKNRFLALQKMAEQKKNEAMNPGGPGLNDGGPPDHNGIPKQTEIRINMHDLNRSMPVGSSSSVRFSNNKGILVNSPRQVSHHHHPLNQHITSALSPITPVTTYQGHVPMAVFNNPQMQQDYNEYLLPPDHPRHPSNQGGHHQGVVHNPKILQSLTPKQIRDLECKKNLHKMLGIAPSDIDKYSRIFFPISFISFNLMYWIIYLHVSDEVAEDLVLLHPDE